MKQTKGSGLVFNCQRRKPMLGKEDKRGTGRGRRGEWGREEGGEGV